LPGQILLQPTSKTECNGKNFTLHSSDDLIYHQKGTLALNSAQL